MKDVLFIGTNLEILLECVGRELIALFSPARASHPVWQSSRGSIRPTSACSMTDAPRAIHYQAEFGVSSGGMLRRARRSHTGVSVVAHWPPTCCSSRVSCSPRVAM